MSNENKSGFLTDSTKVKVTLGIACAIIVSVWGAASWLANTLNRVSNAIDRSEANQARLSRECWHVSDHEIFAAQLERSNRKLDLVVPDTRSIVRDRLPSPKNSE